MFLINRAGLPATVFNHDGPPIRGAAIIGVDIMIDGDEIHFRPDEYFCGYSVRSLHKKGVGV